jgi:hypothetical protein
VTKPDDGQARTSAVLAAEVERLRRAIEAVERTANAASVTATGAKAVGDTLAEQLAALRTEVAGLAALGAQVGVLADRVTELAAGVAGEDEQGQQAKLMSWFDANADQAQQMLLELAQWVYQVLSRYIQVNKTLTNCWHRHPPVVDGLNALRAAWHAAYRVGKGDPRGAVDWHIRLLPGTVDLLRAELSRCDELQHAPGGAVEQHAIQHPRLQPDPDRILEYADWWAAGRGEGQAEPGLPARAPDTSQRPTPVTSYGGYGSGRPGGPPNGRTS